MITSNVSPRSYQERPSHNIWSTLRSLYAVSGEFQWLLADAFMGRKFILGLLSEQAVPAKRSILDQSSQLGQGLARSGTIRALRAT
jgi:hypothetical protein